jgi:hypothetical protein
MKSSLKWRLIGGAAAALAVVTLGVGVVGAQQERPQSEPVVQTPPQEPGPKDIKSPAPDEAAPPDILPPTGAAPTTATPKADDKDDSDNNDSDDNGKDDSGKKGDKPTKTGLEATVGPEALVPVVRQRHGSAIIQALDKITAETIRFEVPVGHAVRYEGLVFTVRSCETTAQEEAMQDSIAYVQVRAEPKVQGGEPSSRQVFTGWMFASSPGLNALQHPIYDAWLIACKA